MNELRDQARQFLKDKKKGFIIAHTRDRNGLIIDADKLEEILMEFASKFTQPNGNNKMREALLSALEFGYKECENGNNLDAAIINFDKNCSR